MTDPHLKPQVLKLSSFSDLPRSPSAARHASGGGIPAFLNGEVWAPSVNLYELDHCYVVCADLAGVDADKVDLQVKDGMLILRGHRPVPTEYDPECFHDMDKRAKVHVMEIDHGPLGRSVELPLDVDTKAIQAKYRNGLLWIRIPKL